MLTSRKEALPFFLVILMFIGFHPTILKGQTHNFIPYSIGEGLPQSQVQTICQDKMGYIWMGTNGGGICRYDGLNFVSYTTSSGLINNRIKDIFEDRAGNLWICTEGGISMINGQLLDNDSLVFDNFTDQQGLPTNKIFCAFEDANGVVWFGTAHGISRLERKAHGQQDHGTSGKQVPVDAGQSKDHHFINTDIREMFEKSDPAIQTIFQSRDGTIWLGGTQAIYRYNNQQLAIVDMGDDISNVWSFAETAEGTLLIGTASGVVKFENSGFQKVSFSRVLQNKSTKSIHISSKGELWFGTDNGLVRYNGFEAVPYSVKEGLSTNVINEIIEDREGNMWFGTDGGGAMKYKDDRFVHFPMKEGEDLNLVLSIMESTNDKMWIATYSGMYVLEGKQITPFLVSNIYKQFTIHTVYEDRKANIWYGVRDYGVFKMDANGLTQYNIHNGLISNNVFSILEDSYGYLWFGTDQGISRFNGKDFQEFTLDDGLGGATVTCIFEDKNREIWIGTDDGLSRFVTPGSQDEDSKDDPQQVMQFINFTMNDGLANNTINAILEDAKQNLWISTDNGLSHFDHKEFKSFTTRDGLSSNLVNSLIIDNEGDLWIGTNKGIDKFNLDDFYSKELVSIAHYTEEEGFMGIECERNAVCKDRDGNLWFGTIKGVIKYNPKEDKPNLVAPLTHITDLSIDFEKFDWRSALKPSKDETKPPSVVLPYGINYLTFHYVGISLTAPEKVRYRYKLEGFDKDWMEETNRTQVDYPMLPPGNYAFKVMAKNNSGIWNKVPTTMKIVIAPPFWQQAWFIIIAIIVGLSVIFFIFYAVFNRKVKRRELNERIANLKLNALRAQMNPHFIFNALNSIQNFINKNEEESANIYLAKFASLMRLILDNTKRSYIPLSDELRLLEIYLDLEKLRFKKKFDYEISIEASLTPEKYNIPSMLIQPYVENAINHGILQKEEEGMVRIDLTKDEDGILCVVEDNGIGRERAQQLKEKSKIGHKSVGISLTKDRLEILNAVPKGNIGVDILDLFKEEGKPSGTRVEILIPVISDKEE